MNDNSEHGRRNWNTVWTIDKENETGDKTLLNKIENMAEEMVKKMEHGKWSK
jgi:hypothetical protein